MLAKSVSRHRVCPRDGLKKIGMAAMKANPLTSVTVTANHQPTSCTGDLRDAAIVEQTTLQVFDCWFKSCFVTERRCSHHEYAVAMKCIAERRNVATRYL
jgi:hypothetical protein